MVSNSNKSSGKKSNSDGWTKGAFSLTSPSNSILSIVCIDDCDNCPLFQNGCAGNCNRWDDKVCANCPCLGSKYVDEQDDIPVTVNPSDNSLADINPNLLIVRKARKLLNDGIPVNVLLSNKSTKESKNEF